MSEHPSIWKQIEPLLDEAMETALGEVDTSDRDVSGAYRRHIRETLLPDTVRSSELTRSVLAS